MGRCASRMVAGTRNDGRRIQGEKVYLIPSEEGSSSVFCGTTATTTAAVQKQRSLKQLQRKKSRSRSFPSDSSPRRFKFAFDSLRNIRTDNPTLKVRIIDTWNPPTGQFFLHLGPGKGFLSSSVGSVGTRSQGAEEPMMRLTFLSTEELPEISQLLIDAVRDEDDCVWNHCNRWKKHVSLSQMQKGFLGTSSFGSHDNNRHSAFYGGNMFGSRAGCLFEVFLNIDSYKQSVKRRVHELSKSWRRAHGCISWKEMTLAVQFLETRMSVPNVWCNLASVEVVRLHKAQFFEDPSLKAKMLFKCNS